MEFPLTVFLMKKSCMKLRSMRLIKNRQHNNYWFRALVAGALSTGSLLSQCWFTQPVAAQTKDYCQLSSEAEQKKESLRQAWLKGNSNAERDYKRLLQEHAELIDKCRSQSWLKNQAIWLRLYPCDARPGEIDALLDRIVNQGYNQVYVEVFFDGQVLLPVNDNPTPWVSAVRSPGAENVDLLAEAIKKGRERGLEVYAWLFTMNFGYSYAQRPDRQQVLARNGRGENSLSVVQGGSEAFIDPYNRQAKVDYYRLVQAVVKRKPDGILFDYIRYPRGTGTQSVAGHVEDLWIYGDAARAALYQRAQNQRGRALIERFLSQGHIKASDVEAVEKLYPGEGEPMWQGRIITPTPVSTATSSNLAKLQLDLWHLTVAHAAQGVIDFLTLASQPAQRQGIPAGAVFFPGGNQAVGQRGYDSRLQPWDKFPASLQWHPMSYAVCGTADCIVEQVQRVVNRAPNQTKVIPALAGVWGNAYQNRPSLEVQMEAIRRQVPEIDSVSHFAYSWQQPESDSDRKFCRL